MKKDFSDMTYIEFKNWCSDRTCDGNWTTLEALSCISIINTIETIHVKGWFKKKATMRAKELLWQELISKED